MANVGPDAGTYRIVSAGSSEDRPFCLEIAGGNMTSGANVQMWGRLYAASQYWKITYDSNGSARIVNLASGKSLDIYAGNMANKTNVRVFNDNGTAAQRWVFEADGYEGSCDGANYMTYVIKSKKNTTFVLDVDGTPLQNRKNVQIYTANGRDLQRWMFVPMPTFASGGTYELRSMLKTSMCVDVAGGSNANGANVQLWSRNGTNSQKFYITEESSGEWSIMSVASRKYIDVKGGASAVGTNVQQYSDNDSRSQRWKLTEYGPTTIDGTECIVVTFGSYVAGSGNTRFMDVKNAMTTNSANVQLGAYEAGTDYSQRFALYPTSPKSDNLVVPANLGWSRSVGDTNRSTRQIEAETLYPSWTTATSWPTDSANGYQWRYRSHSLSATTGVWGDWCEWNKWEPVAVAVEGKNVWAADGLPASVDSSAAQLQYEVQVRAVSYVGDSDDDDRTGGELIVGEFAAATLTSRNAVEVIFGSTLGFGPEGLRIPYTTDYNGTLNIFVHEMYRGTSTTSTNILKKIAVFEDMDSSGSVLIPVSSLSCWLDDEETLTIIYSCDTGDGLADGTIWMPQRFTVSYNTGSGMTVTPTITSGAGRALDVHVANANISKAWLRRSGELEEMAIINHVGKVLYPFGGTLDWELFVAAHSTDGDRWGVATLNGEQFNALLSGVEPCHAFNWNGGSFLLEARKGEYLETNYSIDNDTKSYKLNGREWDSYRFGGTKTGKFKAEGALYEPFDLESTKADLEALLDAQHVVYRSPHGDMCDVAVLSASMVCNRELWTVSVDMVRETV